jgi:RNA polymerase sigma-70 factor (ECF subfamily)
MEAYVHGAQALNATPPTLSEVYEAYHRRVVAYAAKLLGVDEAEDVAQEVFVKVFRSLGTLSDATKLTSWVYAITLNTVRDHARKRSVEPAPTPSPAGVAETDEHSAASLTGIRDTASRSPEEVAIRNEMVACYLDYVRRLPHRYYVVYALSELEDLTNQEIADRLSLSLATVKIRLHRARALLYGELRRHCRCYRNARGELMGEPSAD